MSWAHTSAVAERAAKIRPGVRLFCETMMVNRGGLIPEYSEVEVPVIQLSFEYGGTRVRCTDPLERVFSGKAGAMSWIARDRRQEAQAQYVLESFGAVEIGCLEHYAAPPDSQADYLVQLDGDVHSLCSFSAYALPQLRSFGWRVDVDASYPYQLVDCDAPWYADIAPDEQADWFNLELGVEVAGQRINLMPALLDLIHRSPGDLDALAQLSSGRRVVALPVAEGRYVPLPPERVRSLVRVLIELYQGESDRLSIRFPAMVAGALAHLDEAVDHGLLWSGATQVRDHGAQLASRPGPERAAPPGGLMAELRPYQHEGLSWLQQMRELGTGGILADDMGLGKTLQTIAHLLAEKESGRADRPSLVVAPTSLMGNWRREIKRFAPSLRVVTMHGKKRHARWAELGHSDVVLTTYPLLWRDRERLAEERFYLVILDEAQTIKNSRSKAHRAVKALDAEHRLCLTGTPVENSLDELWSLFDVLMPGLLGTVEQFRAWFRNPIERQGSGARLDALRERVAPYILRRVKEDVAPELPPKTEIVRPVELSGAQRELYENIRVAAHTQVRRAIRKKGLAGSTIAILDALMKLRQVCCDPRLVTVPSARKVRESAKYRLFFELLQKQLEQGRRVLVFSQFTSMLALMAQGMHSQGIGYVKLTGATGDRQVPIDRFERGEADVFLISLKAGGTGLNLTSADTVMHYDPWWNPAAQAQATDRAYRIGQKKPVFVYNLIVAGSVEERMLGLQRRKKQLANIILGRGGSGASLSEREVDALFAPLG